MECVVCVHVEGIDGEVVGGQLQGLKHLAYGMCERDERVRGVCKRKGVRGMCKRDYRGGEGGVRGGGERRGLCVRV